MIDYIIIVVIAIPIILILFSDLGILQIKKLLKDFATAIPEVGVVSHKNFSGALTRASGIYNPPIQKFLDPPLSIVIRNM